MNIFVSNLNYATKDADLTEYFSQFGEVGSAKIITNKYNGRSRGYGFVEMPNDEEGQKAIDATNGQEFQGRPITVTVAKSAGAYPANPGAQAPAAE